MALMDSIRKETCYAGIEGSTDEEILGTLADKLLEQGIVNEHFKENVILREKSYPTGLPLAGYKVAIPHTNACYINETRICIATLKSPVDFHVMGAAPEIIAPIHVVIMLAIREQHAQLDVLQELINLVVRNESMIEELVQAKNGEEIYYILKDCLREESIGEQSAS